MARFIGTAQKLATVLAALRVLQNEDEDKIAELPHFTEMDLVPLDADEIDVLCEQINTVTRGTLAAKEQEEMANIMLRVFPWLDTDEDAPGAQVVEELVTLYDSLRKGVM